MSLDLMTSGFPTAATSLGASVNTILVIVDDKDSVEAIRCLLQAHNYPVVTARDGGQALDRPRVWLGSSHRLHVALEPSTKTCGDGAFGLSD